MATRRRVASVSGASSRGSIFSFGRFKRFRKFLHDLKDHISTNYISRQDCFAKVTKALENDDYWTAGFEMSRFEKLHGRLNNTEMHWLVNYQDYLHQTIKDHILAMVRVSIDQATFDFHDWLNHGTPVEVVSAQSSKTYQKSEEIQAHVIGIKNWTRRAGFLSVIIKKGKQEELVWK